MIRASVVLTLALMFGPARALAADETAADGNLNVRVAAEALIGWSAEGDLALGLEFGKWLGFSGYFGVGAHELVIPQFTAQLRYGPSELSLGKSRFHTALGATVGTLRANGGGFVERIWVPRVCLPHTSCTRDYDAYLASINPYRMRADPGVWLSPELGVNVQGSGYFEQTYFIGWAWLLNRGDVSCPVGECVSPAALQTFTIGVRLRFMLTDYAERPRTK